MRMMSFSRSKLRKLKRALAAAKAAGKDRQAVFQFDGTDFVVGYAELLIERLEEKLKTPS